MQQLVVVFVLGMMHSLLQEGMNLHKHLGALGRSNSMWMEIAPHLLLFTMLLALLAGDAMNIDAAAFKRVATQCIFLAGITKLND